MGKSKYRFTRKGEAIFFSLFISSDVCFGLGIGVQNLILCASGIIGMALATALAFHACNNLNWKGMSQERLAKN